MMKIGLKARRRAGRTSARASAVVMLFVALLVCFGAPVFGQTDADAQAVDKKIEELEKQLQQIKARLQEGEDVRAQIEALEEELGRLKEQIGAEEPGAEEAEDQVAAAASSKQLPPSGEQGAPNPMQDDKSYLTGEDLLDESFPNSFGFPAQTCDSGSGDT